MAARCGAASAVLDGGTWSLTPDGEVNRPRSQVPQAVKAWESRQYAKWVDPSSPGAAAVLGDELELVPVTDLARAHQGDKVTVRLLHLGQPAAGAVVAIDHKPLGETDAAGEARIRVRASGVRDHQRHAAAEGGHARTPTPWCWRPRSASRWPGEPGPPRLALAALVALAAAPAAAHETLHEVERGRAIAVKAWFADGELLAYTAYEVYSPADPRIPWQKGRTDRSGWLAFVPDVPGGWRVRVIDETGHGLDLQVEAPATGQAPAAGGGRGRQRRLRAAPAGRPGRHRGGLRGDVPGLPPARGAGREPPPRRRWPPCSPPPCRRWPTTAPPRWAASASRGPAPRSTPPRPCRSAQGTAFALLKSERAAFRQRDGFQDQKRWSSFNTLALGYGLTPWLSAFLFQPYDWKAQSRRRHQLRPGRPNLMLGASVEVGRGAPAGAAEGEPGRAGRLALRPLGWP